MELPKYVQKDLKVLENAELKTDKYGNWFCDHQKMAEKLFKIGFNYPKKYLGAILEYLGYFDDDDIVLDEADFRDEILYTAECSFIEVMKSYSMYGENVQRQVKFIELGVIGGWFDSPNTFMERYQPKYQSKIKDVI